MGFQVDRLLAGMRWPARSPVHNVPIRWSQLEGRWAASPTAREQLQGNTPHRQCYLTDTASRLFIEGAALHHRCEMFTSVSNSALVQLTRAVGVTSRVWVQGDQDSEKSDRRSTVAATWGETERGNAKRKS